MIYLVSNQINTFSSDLFIHISLGEGINLLQDFEELGLDTETEGLDCHTKKLLLLQIGNVDIQILFDIKGFEGRIPEDLKQYLNTTKTLFILQNAKFDLKFLFKQGVLIKNVYDTMLTEIILTNGLQYSGRDLATIAEKYCNVYLDKSVRGEIISKGLSDAVLMYGAKDIAYLPEIKKKQLQQAEFLDLKRAIDLDNSFVVVLAYVEFFGIKIDINKWEKKTYKNIDRALAIKNQLEQMLWNDKKYKYFSGMNDLFTGKQECILNWDSPKQVIALFNDYGIKTTIKDKGVDKESIDAKILDPQKDDFPILIPYLEYKGVQKEVSTYGLGWRKFINPKTGRIHTTFKQLMDTGRLSCGDKRDGTPNLQNLPAGEDTRSCFIPEKGNIMIDADYSGQETIILVNLSKEKNLVDFYKKGLEDMHSYIAFLMYEEIRPCKIEDIDNSALEYIKKYHKDKRQIAKAAGFAIAYGGNGSTIAKNCNIPKKDGEFVYNSYFKSFPELKQYFDLGFAKADHFKYIQFNNITKRKYLFSKANDYFSLKETVSDPYFWQSNDNPREIMQKFNKAKNDIQRISQNFVIQGSAADLTKYACILFFKELLNRNWWGKVFIVNLIHDELLLECPINMQEEVKEILLSCMENAGKPFCPIVPLKATAEIGDHWVH